MTQLRSVIIAVAINTCILRMYSISLIRWLKRAYFACHAGTSSFDVLESLTRRFVGIPGLKNCWSLHICNMNLFREVFLLCSLECRRRCCVPKVRGNCEAHC